MPFSNNLRHLYSIRFSFLIPFFGVFSLLCLINLQTTLGCSADIFGWSLEFLVQGSRIYPGLKSKDEDTEITFVKDSSTLGPGPSPHLVISLMPNILQSPEINTELPWSEAVWLEHGLTNIASTFWKLYSSKPCAIRFNLKDRAGLENAITVGFFLNALSMIYLFS